MADVLPEVMWAWFAGDDDFITLADLPEDLMVSRDGKVAVFMNDVFAWGCADAEELTEETLAEYKQAISDLRAALPWDDASEPESLKALKAWAGVLFAARRRELQPQFCCYPSLSTPQGQAVAGLLDAVGPMRPVDFSNPHRHPRDGGGYAYRKGMDHDPEVRAFWAARKV